MGRKKRKAAKINIIKEARDNKKSLVLFTAASDKVVVPDYTVNPRKRIRVFSESFVNDTCIQNTTATVWSPKKPTVACGNVPKVKSRKKKLNYFTEPFVSKECLVDSTTPVLSFMERQTIVNTKEKKAAVLRQWQKKRRLKVSTEIVPQDCRSAEISLSYRPEKTAKEPLSPGYYPSYGPVFRRKKRAGLSGQFVPKSCITYCAALPYLSDNLTMEEPIITFSNPYPDPPGLTPAITGGNRIRPIYRRAKASFIPQSCITDRTAAPYISNPASDNTPKIKYVYVDRPNSPDIVGNQIKRNKKKSSNTVPFVPKGCASAEINRSPAVPAQNRDGALAREAVSYTPVQQKSRTNWLVLVFLVFVLMVVIGYLLER